MATENQAEDVWKEITHAKYISSRDPEHPNVPRPLQNNDYDQDFRMYVPHFTKPDWKIYLTSYVTHVTDIEKGSSKTVYGTLEASQLRGDYCGVYSECILEVISNNEDALKVVWFSTYMEKEELQPASPYPNRWTAPGFRRCIAPISYLFFEGDIRNKDPPIPLHDNRVLFYKLLQRETDGHYAVSILIILKDSRDHVLIKSFMTPMTIEERRQFFYYLDELNTWAVCKKFKGKPLYVNIAFGQDVSVCRPLDTSICETARKLSDSWNIRRGGGTARYNPFLELYRSEENVEPTPIRNPGYGQGQLAFTTLFSGLTDVMEREMKKKRMLVYDVPLSQVRLFGGGTLNSDNIRLFKVGEWETRSGELEKIVTCVFLAPEGSRDAINLSESRWKMKAETLSLLDNPYLVRENFKWRHCTQRDGKEQHLILKFSGESELILSHWDVVRKIEKSSSSWIPV